MIDPATDRRTWVRAAAWNNAEWCAAMVRTYHAPADPTVRHPRSLGGMFTESLWRSQVAPPPLHPDAVTLTPDASAAAALALIDAASVSPSVKDSFACLDLTGQGFSRLFDAQWIVHEPEPAATVPTWSVVRDEAGLAAWASAWDGGQGLADIFRPGLLAEPDVAVLAGRADGRVVAGAVANRSAAVVGVVGLSNVFALDGDPDGAWTGALAAVAQLWPGLPVVGYEHGDDLAVAVAHGFTPVGPLTVWLRW